MIRVLALSKVYTSHRKKTSALQGVSFCLPERGFVFVVGKSGCGKSTLLNLLGGCDRLTSGEILVDGNKFSDFTERDLDRFRNDCVGFVFQDHCLLEGLTVEQNVALAMQLGGRDDRASVYHALKMVELEGLERRYPKELSGGQKQRVAIARAIVKRPKLILADEPTGNLDAASSRTVLEILKGISREALVVIVSHNRPDAEQYADRIIELSEGRIVGDVTRDQAAGEVEIAAAEVRIQRGAVLSEKQVEAINEAMRRGAQLRQIDSRFFPTPPSDIPPPEPVTHATPSDMSPAQPKKFTRRGKRTLLKLFMRRRAVSIAVTVLTVAIMTVVLGICQLFLRFAPDREISRMLSEGEAPGVFVMQKGYYENEVSKTLSTDIFARATEEDIAIFREAGYRGGIYPLYNISLMTHTAGENVVNNLEKYNLPYDSKNYANFYCSAGYGVLVTEKAYVASIYGDEEGKLTLLSGTLSTEGGRIIVTDYFADSILAYNSALKPLEGDPYALITNGQPLFSRYRVCGVIATGYRERYQALREQYLAGEGPADWDQEAYTALLDELDGTLNIAYSFDPDFYAAYCADLGLDRPVYYGTYSVRCGANAVTFRNYCSYDPSLSTGEVRVNQSVLARLWGIAEEEVTEERALGAELTLTRYEYNPIGAPADYRVTVTVAGLMRGDFGDFAFSKAEYLQAAAYGSLPYALYFGDVSNVTSLYEIGAQRNFAVRSPLVSAIYTVGRAADIFTDVFGIIGVLLFLLTALTLLSFGAGSVRKNLYEIAVIRAMGGSSRDVALMFVLLMLAVSLAACVFFAVGLAFGAGLCNALLSDGFVAFTGNAAVRELGILVFHWGTALADAAIILSLTAVAALVPLWMMRKSKPCEILRVKE